MSAKIIKKRGPYKQYIHDSSKKLPKCTFYNNLKNGHLNNLIQMKSNETEARIQIQRIIQSNLVQSIGFPNKK